MCNLYHHSVSASELKRFAAGLDLPVSTTAAQSNFEPGFVGADSDGPIIAVEGGELVVRERRWGFPSWSEKGKPITNIRNLNSSWWKGANGEYISKSQYRCLVPFNRFAEWDKAKRGNAWFEVHADFPCFAGFWRPWHGERLKNVDGKKRRERTVDDWELYAFMTTEPNPTVAAIHPKAMPAIIATAEEARQWLDAESGSFELQRPLDDALVSIR